MDYLKNNNNNNKLKKEFTYRVANSQIPNLERNCMYKYEIVWFFFCIIVYDRKEIL